MNFDTEDLDDGIAGLDGLIVQNPQPHVLTNSIRDFHIESGESMASLASIP